MFSKEEDELILNYVNRHGATIETFKTINFALKRTRPSVIKVRFLHLKSKEQNEIKTKEKRDWDLSEQEIMIEFMLKVRIYVHIYICIQHFYGVGISFKLTRYIT